MKTRLILILVMSSLSAFVWGQNNHSPQISLNYLSQQKDNNLRSLPGISLPARKVKDQKPTSLKERCIAISNTENNVKIDSFLLFYSYGRGSETVPNSDGTYDISANTDTIVYYSYDRGNFKIGWPNRGSVYNKNNHKIRETSYYYENIPYQTDLNTWDTTDTYVSHRKQIINYVLNSNDSSHDNYYQATDLNKDGYGLRDTIKYTYNKHDKSGNSNYFWTSKLDIDSQGRPGFQIRHNTTLNEITIDSIWREWLSPVSKKITREIIKTTTKKKSGTPVTVIWDYQYHYNGNELVDTVKILYNNNPYQLIVYSYNNFDQETEISYFDFLNSDYLLTYKIINEYIDDYQISYTSYTRNMTNGILEEEFKIIVTYNNQDLWDTVKTYSNSVLTSTVVQTFTKDGNIRTKTKYENSKTTLTTYYYEEYNLTGIDMIVSNLLARIYPNPISNEFRLNIDEAEIDTYELVITDMTGQTINKYTVDNNEAIISTQNLKSGIYMALLTNKNKTRHYAQKIIKI